MMIFFQEIGTSHFPFAGGIFNTICVSIHVT